MNDSIKAMREELSNKILAMINTGSIGTWLKEWKAADAPYNLRIRGTNGRVQRGFCRQGNRN